jgi:hypothetical protein
MKMGEACGRHGGRKGRLYTVLVGTPQGKKLLRRPRRRWENIKMK